MTKTRTRVRAAGSIADQIAEVAESLRRAEVVRSEDPADLVVMRAAEFEAIRRALDDMTEDALATAAYLRTRDQESVPIEVADRLLAGENPVRVWREYRGLSLTALAGKAAMGKGYLSQIENGERTGTVETLGKLAEVLGIDLDDLT